MNWNRNKGQFISIDEDKLLDKYLKEHSSRLNGYLDYLSKKYHIGKHGHPTDSEGSQNISDCRR